MFNDTCCNWAVDERASASWGWIEKCKNIVTKIWSEDSNDNLNSVENVHAGCSNCVGNTGRRCYRKHARSCGSRNTWNAEKFGNGGWWNKTNSWWHWSEWICSMRFQLLNWAATIIKNRCQPQWRYFQRRRGGRGTTLGPKERYKMFAKLQNIVKNVAPFHIKILLGMG